MIYCGADPFVSQDAGAAEARSPEGPEHIVHAIVIHPSIWFKYCRFDIPIMMIPNIGQVTYASIYRYHGSTMAHVFSLLFMVARAKGHYKEKRSVSSRTIEDGAWSLTEGSARQHGPAVGSSWKKL